MLVQVYIGAAANHYLYIMDRDCGKALYPNGIVILLATNFLAGPVHVR